MLPSRHGADIASLELSDRIGCKPVELSFESELVNELRDGFKVQLRLRY